MLYQALYRKYRPRTFDDVSGQDVIVKTLKNIVKTNKLTHAYLFIGPRGTGKTSIAKIFAKTINCENPVDGISCENCQNCINDNANENIDIIEMDAASNNGVDEIREIKNHVTLLPTMSKYKVYIIDEVHMLTTGAFNALLKTLEEPPSHVIFILATTEPHKIPLTIISRCQSFEFKPISKPMMIERLKYICSQENISITEEALNLIALDSNGGMRDAIGLLDQLNAYTNSKIDEKDVILLSGRIQEDDIYNIFNLIISNNLKECFDIIQNFEDMGKDFSYICEDIIKYLRNSLLSYQMGTDEKIVSLLGEKNIIDIIMIFNNSINDMKNTKDKRIFFDLTIIKILNIYKNNKQTNVQENENDISPKEDKINVEKEVKKENHIEKEQKNQNTELINLFGELMDIRMNNILADADKSSLQKYNNLIVNLESDITNLDHLKTINLILDCTLKAGSKDGLILTTDSNNILNELYENFTCIEETLSAVNNENIKVCFLLDEYWLNKREEYVEKIRKKQKIDKLDENVIISQINGFLQNKEETEFEDLLEIGEN